MFQHSLVALDCLQCVLRIYGKQVSSHIELDITRLGADLLGRFTYRSLRRCSTFDFGRPEAFSNAAAAFDGLISAKRWRVPRLFSRFLSPPQRLCAALHCSGVLQRSRPCCVAARRKSEAFKFVLGVGRALNSH